MYHKVQKKCQFCRFDFFFSEKNEISSLCVILIIYLILKLFFINNCYKQKVIYVFFCGKIFFLTELLRFIIFTFCPISEFNYKCILLRRNSQTA